MNFPVLQNELKVKSTKIVLVAFDLPYLNAYDLRKLLLIAKAVSSTTGCRVRVGGADKGERPNSKLLPVSIGQKITLSYSESLRSSAETGSTERGSPAREASVSRKIDDYVAD